MTTLARIAALACAAAVLLASGAALAEKPEWAGKGKGKGKERAAKGGKHFQSGQRVAIHDYYAGEFRGGRCPPGLAKKRNGCMPPGQAKKWRMGRSLPQDVVVYPLPRELVVRIGLPPAGHEYVRIASDILLIATGTRMVVDAIEDLGRI